MIVWNTLSEVWLWAFIWGFMPLFGQNEDVGTVLKLGMVLSIEVGTSYITH